MPSGKLAGFAISKTSHLHHVERGGDAFPQFGLRNPTLLQAVRYILGHRQVGEKRVRLEDGVDVPGVRRDADNRFTGDPDVARIRVLETRDHA